MTEQTKGLVKSLPYCASLLIEANTHGSHNWQVVRSSIHFTQAKPENWKPIEPFLLKGEFYSNLFSNRTAALRASGRLSSQWKREQKGRKSEEDIINYYGVWEMQEGGIVFWQTVLPAQ